MGTLEDLRQRLFNIGQVIREILDLFTYVKLSRSELDAAFDNLNTGKIERALDDLRNVIEQQRVYCGDTTGEEKHNELLKDIKQEQVQQGNKRSFKGFQLILWEFAYPSGLNYIKGTSFLDPWYGL